jgi:hypothetical protein
MDAEISSHIVPVKHRVVCQKPVPAACQRNLVVASICSIVAIALQPRGDGSRIQSNGSFVPGPSNHMAGESPVREWRCGGVIAFCPAKASIKRKGRKEHAGPLREVEETPRERPNIYRSLGVCEASLAVDYKISSYW